MLYQTFRPQKFSEVVGQSHIINPIQNALVSNNFPHSVLLVGPRGLGKTTLARLICKWLNCENPQGNEVCGQCDNCLSVAEGTFVDMIELDAASNRGIDTIRQTILERVYNAPTNKVKVYIIDEAHMLTQQASNALLKILEEPPENVVFVLCTTEEEKILTTIKSRCQLHRYRLISQDSVVLQLKMIVGTLKEEIPSESLKIVAGASGGSMRDAVMLLELIVASGKKEPEEVREQLGQLTDSAVIELITHIGEKNLVEAFQTIEALIENTEDPTAILTQIELWGQKLLQYLVGIDFNEDPNLSSLEKHATLFSFEDIIRLFEVFTKWRGKILPVSKVTFELGVVEFLATQPKEKETPETSSGLSWLLGSRKVKSENNTTAKVSEPEPKIEVEETSEEREPDF